MTSLHGREVSQSQWRILGILSTAVVAFLDYITVDEVNVTLFYLIPLSIACWKLSKGEAIVAAVVSALAWVGGDIAFGRATAHPFIALWNTLMLFGFFLTVVLILATLKVSFHRQRDLIRELQGALANVKTLRGLLPICAWCKRIRDDSGYWQAVEKYVEDNSSAEFTHGICPECSVKFSSKRR